MFQGIKAISFKGVWAHDRAAMAAQGSLLGLSVLLINFESWLMKRIVAAATSDEGHIVLRFHPHPLVYRPKLSGHRCDLCREKGPAMYRCQARADRLE